MSTPTFYPEERLKGPNGDLCALSYTDDSEAWNRDAVMSSHYDRNIIKLICQLPPEPGVEITAYAEFSLRDGGSETLAHSLGITVDTAEIEEFYGQPVQSGIFPEVFFCTPDRNLWRTSVVSDCDGNVGMELSNIGEVSNEIDLYSVNSDKDIVITADKVGLTFRLEEGNNHLYFTDSQTGNQEKFVVKHWKKGRKLGVNFFATGKLIPVSPDAVLFPEFEYIEN